jgi:hypothetical protein
MCTNPGGYHDAQVWLMQRGKIPAGDRVDAELSSCPWGVTDVSWREYVGITPSQYPQGLADQWYRKVIPPGRHQIVLNMKGSQDVQWGLWVYGARRLSDVQLRYMPEAGSPALPALLPPSRPEFEPQVWTVRQLE